VDAERPQAVLVGRADPHLEVHGAVLGEHQRCLEGQFLDAVAAHLVGRAKRQFGERCAGQQDGVHDPVLGEPGVRPQ
jgi:hypothetical protein